MSPSVKKGEWTEDEDALIFQMFQTLGPKWTVIAKCLEGRTDNSIKNRFYSTIRKMKAQGQDPEISVKYEVSEEKVPESEERMSTLINQIQHFQSLLESTKSQIFQLENSFDGSMEGLQALQVFHNGLQSINPSDFNS